MKIYLDILMITNAVITLIYLRCICRITHERLTLKRELTSAAIGGAGSLLVTAQSSGFGGALIITTAKLAVILLIVIQAYRPASLSVLVRRTALFLLFELLLGGACMAWVSLTHSPVILIKNYVVYFDVTLPQLGFCCAAVYLATMLLETVKRRSDTSVKRYRAEYRLGAYSLTLPAIADTGNRLCDSFTGAPVVIFRSDELYSRLNLDRPEQLLFYGFHPVPFETIGGEGLIYVTCRGSVTISDADCSRPVSCCTGVLPSGGKKGYAIFDPEILY